MAKNFREHFRRGFSMTVNLFSSFGKKAEERKELAEKNWGRARAWLRIYRGIYMYICMYVQGRTGVDDT